MLVCIVFCSLYDRNHSLSLIVSNRMNWIPQRPFDSCLFELLTVGKICGIACKRVCDLVVNSQVVIYGYKRRIAHT